MSQPDSLRTVPNVVFDATFLLGLARLGVPELQLLRTLFLGRAVIPGAVELELRRSISRRYAPAAQALIGRAGILRTVRLDEAQAQRAKDLRALMPSKDPNPARPETENLGEAEAVILAQDLGATACAFIVDERDATKAAVGRRVNVLSSPYVLMLAAFEGARPDADCWDVYVRVVAAGMGVPREGWQPDAAGRARFHRELAEWRARVGVQPGTRD